MESPLRAPHKRVYGERVHPRGREEEGDHGGVTHASCDVQRRLVPLHGGRTRGVYLASRKETDDPRRQEANTAQPDTHKVDAPVERMQALCRG